jgi:hypothetical protein
MYRRVNLAKLELVRGNLDITITEAPQRISESAKPTVNSDFKQEGAKDANDNVQRK